MQLPPLKTIESPNNPVIKEFKDYFARSNFRKKALFPVEGPQFVADALRCGLYPEAILVHRNFAESEKGSAVLSAGAGKSTRYYLTTERLLHKVSSTEQPQGVLALFRKPKSKNVSVLAREPVPILAMVDVQDPGNCGSLLRSFLAFGGKILITLGSTADPYGPKAVRASAGAIFRVSTIHFQTAEELRAWEGLGAIPWIATSASYGKRPESCSIAPPLILFIGNEGSGLPPSLLASCQETLSLPMSSSVESLNAAIAGSLVIYDLCRGLCIGPFKADPGGL